jgi:hypothetical protein
MPPNEMNGTPEVQPPKYPTIDRYFNRNHDPEDLVRYHGQWVAWSLDGRKVLFASPDPYKLCEMIDAAGLKSEECVIDGLDAPWR